MKTYFCCFNDEWRHNIRYDDTRHNDTQANGPICLHRISGLYYKPITIVNDDSRVINKLEGSLTDDARVVIYDCHMFIARATDYLNSVTLSVLMPSVIMLDVDMLT